MKKNFTRPQKMTIAQGIFSIVLIVAILQLWLLTATMNAFLGGDAGVLIPAALFSLICLSLNIRLLKFLFDLDHKTLDSPAPKRKGRIAHQGTTP
jgi:uncharacterized YccA/Bax inhibitor family protein